MVIDKQSRVDAGQKQLTVLLTLGRLPVCVDLARALAKHGHRVVVADPLRWHLCCASRHVSKVYQVPSPMHRFDEFAQVLRQIVKQENVDLLVPVSEEIMYVSMLHKNHLPNVKTYADELDKVLSLHDKWRFNQLAESYDLPVPRSAVANSKEALAITNSGAYIVKPRLSCAGSGVVFGRAGQSVPVLCNNDEYIVQAYVEGTELSVFLLAEAGQVRVEICYQSTLVDGSVGVGFKSQQLPLQLKQWVADFIKLTGFTGAIGFDFLQDGNASWQAIECNPRFSSGVHFVDSNALARAVLAEPCLVEACDVEHADTRPIKYKCEFWSCLTQLFSSVFIQKQGKNPNWYGVFKSMKQSKNVVWSREDPWPFILMPLLSGQILMRSVKTGRSFAQVCVDDIGWYTHGQNELQKRPVD